MFFQILYVLGAVRNDNDSAGVQPACIISSGEMAAFVEQAFKVFSVFLKACLSRAGF